MTTGDPAVLRRIDRLDPARSVLLVVDFQERLAAAMPDKALHHCLRNAQVLVQVARTLEFPIVVSQQYPSGLGATVSGLTAEIERSPQVHRFDKLTFSVCDDDSFATIWEQLKGEGRDQWIVLGIEAHVCVFQTVRDLVGRGAQVMAVADAVLSRAKANWKIGTRLMAQSGASVVSTEVVLFDLVRRAGTEPFKQLAPLIR